MLVEEGVFVLQWSGFSPGRERGNVSPVVLISVKRIVGDFREREAMSPYLPSGYLDAPNLPSKPGADRSGDVLSLLVSVDI